MAEFVNYLFQSSAYAILFYFVFYFFLRRLTFFAANRFYLLASLALSLLIPLLTMDMVIDRSGGVTQFIPSWHIEELPAKPVLTNAAGNPSPLNWISLLTLAYAGGALVVFIRLVISLLIVGKAIHTSRVIERSGGVRIVEGTGRISNCSFFNTIFVLPGKLTNEEYLQLVEHEECHIRLYHSFDKLFIHLVLVFAWFNPAIYLYRQSIDETHEFEVDALLTKKTNKKVYVGILLDLALKKKSFLLNHFSSEQLKVRIKMLFTSPSRKFKKTLYAVAIPVALIGILSFSMPNTSSPSIKDDNSISETPASPFLVRTTLKGEDGNEYDEIRLRFGNSNLVGGVRKGGKVLYLIGEKEYTEEEVKLFTQADVAGFSCPCSVQAIRKDKEPLISGIYEGVVKISNAN